MSFCSSACKLRLRRFIVILSVLISRISQLGGYMALTKKAQEVVDYLTKQHEKFLATAEGVNDAQANFKPSENHWSIRELFHHVCIVEGMTAKLMANLLKKAKENNLPADADPDSSVLNSLESHQETFKQKFQAPERVVPIDALP